MKIIGQVRKKDGNLAFGDYISLSMGLRLQYREHVYFLF